MTTAEPPEERIPDDVPVEPAEETTGHPEVDDPVRARAEALESEPGGLRGVTDVHKPSTLGGVLYLAVLAGALIGLGIVATGAWRTGVSWLAVALLAAAGARLVLRDEDAGMLRVRRKALDAGILLVLGVGILVLVATIPNQPG